MSEEESSKETEESGEVDMELEKMAEEVMKKYLAMARVDIRAREESGGVEEIVMEHVEIPEEVQPILEEVPVEKISPAEIMREQINETITEMNELVKTFRGKFREAVRKQLITIRKNIRDLGNMIALAFVSKIGITHLRRKLEASYKDIVDRELKTREPRIFEAAIAPLEPFYKELVSRLNELTMRLSGLRDAYEKWLLEYTTVLRDLSSATEEVEDVEDLLRENRMLRGKIDELMDKYEHLRTENEELNRKLSEIEKKYGAIIEEKEKTIKELRSQIEDLRKKIEASVIPEEKRREYEKILDENKKLQEELAKRAEEMVVLQKRLRDLEIKLTELKSLEETKKLYEAKLAEKDRIIAELRSQLESGIGSADLLKKYEDVYSKYVQATEHVKILEKELNALREENEKLKKTIEDLRTQIAETKGIEDIRKIYEEKLAEKDRIISELKATISRLESESEIAKRYNELRSEYMAVVEKNKLLQQELAKRARETEELRKELSELKAKLAEYAGFEKIKQLYESKLAEKDRQIEELRKKIAEMEGMIASMEALREEISSLREFMGKTEEKPSAEISLEEYRKLLESMKDEIIKLREELRTKTKRLGEVEATLKVYEDQIKILQSQLAEYKKGAAASSVEFRRLQEENLKLKEQLRIATERYNELSKRLETLKREPEELRAILSETPLGKIYLQIRALRRASIDLLAKALGMPKHLVLRELQNLARVGIIKLTGTQVIYQGEL